MEQRISESRLVREYHQPRIEDNLWTQVRSCPETWSSQNGTYWKEDMAASNDTEPNRMSCVYSREL